MRLYTIVWAVTCAPILGVALVVGLLLVSPPIFVGALLIGAVVGALTARPATNDGPGTENAFRAVLVRGLLVGTGAGAVVALGVLLGALTVPCLVVFGVTSPPVVRWTLRWLYGSSPKDMSDYQLCSVWRSTTHDLPHRAPHQRLDLVQQRQAYLDEMELRNGSGFYDWLESGGAEDALECFLVRGSRPGPRSQPVVLTNRNTNPKEK